MLQEQPPSVAEHAFGNSVKRQVVVENPQYAILLGLRHLGWLTFKQCEIRVFSWSYENVIANSPVHRDLTRQTLIEMEEIGLVKLQVFGWIFHPDGTEEPWIISKVFDANPGFTKRYNMRVNDGSCNEDDD